jgi:nucleoid DNA-binding protein
MNKQATIRAVAGKTGHTYFEVQTMLEGLIDVWADALAEGDHIAIQDFLTIKVTEIKTHRRGKLRNHDANTPMRRVAYRVDARLSILLKLRLHNRTIFKKTK